MKTPICDFVKKYAQDKALRLHMPGHKGKPFIGAEHLDITEIAGADSLYEASGIIAESEKNASELFGCPTFYSTEGSSQCIRAMLYLAQLFAREKGRNGTVLAARNAHKTFHSAAALLDIDVEWLYGHTDSYLSCDIEADDVEQYFKNAEITPCALYITSPDYLGNIADIKKISAVCRKYGALLLVDNAHGAYLKFLQRSEHPIDLGADICCDSAHKTLPVLTGGAYLHISKSLFDELGYAVKDALSLFGSTSPSYLILQSLDAVNTYLEYHRERLEDFINKVNDLKNTLVNGGYSLYGDEALKITVQAKKYGYYGTEFAEILFKNGIVCEFSDRDFTVLMLTPENSEKELIRLKEVMLSIPQREEISESMPSFSKKLRAVSIREAALSPFETVSVTDAIGRVSSVSVVGCPPAVPITVSGEIIDENAAECFKYYGINTCKVIKRGAE